MRGSVRCKSFNRPVTVLADQSGKKEKHQKKKCNYNKQFTQGHVAGVPPIVKIASYCLSRKGIRVFLAGLFWSLHLLMVLAVGKSRLTSGSETQKLPVRLMDCT